jgi:hypothetical protein
MKKILSGALVLSLFMLSCSKDDDGGGSTTTTYLSITPGQTRSFEVKDSISGNLSSITQTSTNRDTSVNGRSYHVFNNSDGSFEYYAVAGSEYYTLFNLPATISTQPIELLYLKSNGSINSTWTQNISFTVPGFPIPIPVTFTHTIKEKGLTKTYGAITHNNVIRVETKISSSLASINSDIQTYVAPNYGVVNITTYI